MKLSFPHTDLLIEHLAQGTKVSSILFDHIYICIYIYIYAYIYANTYKQEYTHVPPTPGATEYTGRTYFG